MMTSFEKCTTIVTNGQPLRRLNNSSVTIFEYTLFNLLKRVEAYMEHYNNFLSALTEHI